MVTVGLCCNLCAVKKMANFEMQRIGNRTKSEYKCFAESSLEPEKKNKLLSVGVAAPCMHF